MVLSFMYRYKPREVALALDKARSGQIPALNVNSVLKPHGSLVVKRLCRGVPVGFVNVVQSKELIMKTDVPYIVAKGRKGGSNIAACICNALLYMMDDRR